MAHDCKDWELCWIGSSKGICWISFCWKFSFTWRNSICWKFNLFIWQTFVSQEWNLFIWWNYVSWKFYQRFRPNIATSWFYWKWSISVSVRNSVGPSWNCQNLWMHERCFRSSGRSLWRLGAFYEKRERDHRVNKDVAISKSTLPTCSLMESMESDYRPLRVNGQHGWRRTLCFHYKAHCHFACECPNLSVLDTPSSADMNLNWRHSMKSRNRQGSVNDKQMAVIDLNSMIRRNLRDFDLNSLITRNLCDFVNDMETFNFNGPLVVARDANFDNMGGQQNDLVPDIDDDHAIPWVGINPDEFTQTLQNFPGVCQWDSFANDEIICDTVHSDMTSTRAMVSPGFGHQNTGRLDDVNCDARHDYSTGINRAPAPNLYQTGSYEMKSDERFISCDSDVNPISSEPCDTGNVSIIGTCTYTENVGFTKDFDNFRGCQTDINIIHLTTGTYEFHLHFCDDNSNELQLYEVWGVIKLFRFREIRHRKEIYQSNSWDCNSTTVSPLCEWPCWTLGLLMYVSVNELTQFHGNFSFLSKGL